MLTREQYESARARFEAAAAEGWCNMVEQQQGPHENCEEPYLYLRLLATVELEALDDALSLFGGVLRGTPDSSISVMRHDLDERPDADISLAVAGPVVASC